ncbi:hypothetical protein PROAA_1350003 [Candidatus Propionivibrio aalborgensis]|uniref:Uncharacterized protein n=1 Tax=Candidatus Propionivibrio aalborgensis TaxID=1860101 RepID=A0A1A8XLB5_9RHOO|nr:hypothetical protein PROAA_1350003 [Candidatus Propionivibrio aalborgensis]
MFESLTPYHEIKGLRSGAGLSRFWT